MIKKLWYYDTGSSSAKERIAVTKNSAAEKKPVKRLEAAWHTDPVTEYRLRVVKSTTEHFKRHCHDYYEIFLIVAGSAFHAVNGASQSLSAGHLLFIRKDDVHDYVKADGAFEMVNLAFTESTFEALCAYLGDGFPAERLLASPLPPAVRLGENETKRLFYKLVDTGGQPDADPLLRRMKMRSLLAEIFVTYFTDPPFEDSAVPFWLEYAYEKMKLPKNFIKGKEKLFELTGKTKEHTARSLKKHYGVTPSDYVNDLRLSYAAGLLASGDLNATDVCYECGFQNVSWFYTAFEKKYGVTPARYRKEMNVFPSPGA